MDQALAADSQQILPIQLPGVILGLGLGGFVDGIFLHQVFQWHHMFSSVYPVDTVSEEVPASIPTRSTIPPPLPPNLPL